MLWSFHRDGEHFAYEIRSPAEGDGLELVIRQSDGRETVELFADGNAVDARAKELQLQLLNDGWWIAGDPRR